MNRQRPLVTPSYARFSWYWQPDEWLKKLSEKNVVETTAKAIDLESKKQRLLEQVTREQNDAAERYKKQIQILSSLYSE